MSDVSATSRALSACYYLFSKSPRSLVVWSLARDSSSGNFHVFHFSDASSTPVLSQADENLRFSEDGDVLLMRDQHVAFLMKVFDGLPGSYVSLDASRTWLVYWAVQSLCLLGATIPDGIQARIIGATYYLI